MSKSKLIIAKEAIEKEFTLQHPILRLSHTHEDFTAAYRTFRKHVWEITEQQMKESYKNGVADGGCSSDASLLDVTHYMCARLTAMAEIMSARHDWSYGGQVIAELSETLQRMPFTDEEGALVHRTLEPVVRAYGMSYETRPPCLLHEWMKPLVDALKKVPGKLADVPSAS